MMRDAKEWLEWRAVSPIRGQDFHEGFVAEMTESASQGTPFAPVQLCGDSIRPHPGAAEFTGPKISEWRYGVPRLLSFYAVTMVLNPGGEGKSVSEQAPPRHFRGVPKCVPGHVAEDGKFAVNCKSVAMVNKTAPCPGRDLGDVVRHFANVRPLPQHPFPTPQVGSPTGRGHTQAGTPNERSPGLLQDRGSIERRRTSGTRRIEVLMPLVGRAC